VGQTMNRFSTLWSAYRSTWKAGYTGEGLEDKAALSSIFITIILNFSIKTRTSHNALKLFFTGTSK